MKEVELWEKMRYNFLMKIMHKMCGVQEGNYDSTGVL